MPAAVNFVNPEHQHVKSGTKQLLVCALLCLSGIAASADEVTALYSAEVAVPDQARATQNSFLGKAFENVLVKLSGQRLLPETATPEMLSARARSNLQSLTYHQYTLPIDEQTEYSELRMQAQFDTAAVNNALVYLGLPRWPVERSRLQFIMAIELDNMRRLISIVSESL